MSLTGNNLSFYENVKACIFRPGHKEIHGNYGNTWMTCTTGCQGFQIKMSSWTFPGVLPKNSLKWNITLLFITQDKKSELVWKNGNSCCGIKKIMEPIVFQLMHFSSNAGKINQDGAGPSISKRLKCFSVNKS